MKTLKISQIAVLVGAVCATPALWAQDATPADSGTQAATDVGKIQVEGQSVNNGLIQAEETPKARSSVNRAHLETMVPTSNPYQAIEMLPGVSTFSYDGTGLFGGGLRVRGANSDQMGFTINGAPVNDSGNFAVFPQEYADMENLCDIFVTQGSADTEAPHVGASGGNVGMVTCAPSDNFAVRFTQSFGQLSFHRSFLRVNSGKMLGDTLKGFISFSTAKADKFKGPGEAKKFHIDAGVEFKPSDKFTLSSSFLLNRELNNNILTLSYDNIAQLGYNADYSTSIPQHLPAVAGTAQNETLPAATNNYYGFQLNPFKNYLWTAKAEYKVNKDLSFSVLPYFWYGFGTGGSQNTTLKEGAGQTPQNTGAGFPAASLGRAVGGGIGDLNGDGDLLDTILVYGSSVTKTYRPGATFQANARVGEHNLLASFWYERARHRQTAPRQLYANDGSVPSLWQDLPQYFIKRADGTTVEGRDQYTITTGSSLALQDSFYLVPDKLNVTLGVRSLSLERNYTNYANEASGTGTASTGNFFTSAGNYNVDVTARQVLPSVGLRYTVDAERQVFFNVSQGMRVPSNFVFQNLAKANTGTWVNGVWTGFALRTPNVTPETSTNMEGGFRFANDSTTLSVTMYHNEFRNRIASSFDPQTQVTTDYNVGGVTSDGIEAELGYKINSNWSVYASATYDDTFMKSSNVCQTASATACTAFYQTTGKQMPDTPSWLGGLSINYKIAGFFANLDAKYTGKNFSTLVNDQIVKSTTLFNLSTGYKFGDLFGILKNPSLTVNVNNLLDKKYVRISSASGSSFQAATLPSSISTVSGQPTNVFYYVGAPRFTSVTLSSDF